MDRLTRENVELAGRVGFLQSGVLQLREQVKLLSALAPQPASEPEPADPMPIETAQGRPNR